MLNKSIFIINVIVLRDIRQWLDKKINYKYFKRYGTLNNNKLNHKWY